MIEIIDEELKGMINNMMQHDLSPFKIYNPGDYENESIVLIANRDCCLYDFLLFQVARTDEDLPDHAKSHFLTFDEIDIKAGERVCIYTCRGEDREEIGLHTGVHYYVVYWNLDAPVWTKHDNEIAIMDRGNSMSVYLNPDRVKKY